MGIKIIKEESYMMKLFILEDRRDDDNYNLSVVLIFHNTTPQTSIINQPKQETIHYIKSNKIISSLNSTEYMRWLNPSNLHQLFLLKPYPHQEG